MNVKSCTESKNEVKPLNLPLACVPVLELAKVLESASSKSNTPPPLQRTRFSRINSEKIMSKKASNHGDARPKGPVPIALEGESRVNPFQLDLTSIIEKKEKGKAKGKAKAKAKEKAKGKAKGKGKGKGKTKDSGIKKSISSSLTITSRVKSIRSVRRLETNPFFADTFTSWTARSYLPDFLNQEMVLDFVEFPNVMYKVKVFEKTARKCLRSCFKAGSPTEVNGRVIEESVHRLCLAEIDGLFQKSNTPLSADLQITESTRAKALIKMVQISGAILLPVIERLQIFRNALKEYIVLRKYASPNIRLLAQALDDLVVQEQYTGKEDYLGLVGGKEITNFVKTWDRFCALKSMKPFVKIIEQAFGDTKRDRKEVLAAFKKWINPPHEIFLLLKQNVHRMDWDNIAAMNIPYFVHEWREAADSKNPISEITLHEIIRCMHTGTGIPMKKLTVNEIVFYDEAMRASEPLPSEREFLFELIARLYQAGLKPVMEGSKIWRHVDRLLKWKELRLEKQKKAISAHPLPCMRVLRLLTNSAWGHGDEYLRNLFPKLFCLPYWTKAIQSLEYDVVIKSASHFTVKMNRTYATYLRIAPDNSESCVVDRMKPLVEFNFSWSLSPEGKGWKGALCVEHCEVKPIAGEHKWPILKSVIQYDEKDLQNHPSGTPRMRSTPRMPLPRLSDSYEQLMTSKSSTSINNLSESSSSSSSQERW